MIKTNRLKKTYPQKREQLPFPQDPEKNKTLIFGGVILTIFSIGLLIFVLSEKVFHLS